MAKGKLAVGLDIGSGSVKVCHLKPAKRGNYQLQAFGMVQLPPEAIVDGALMNSTAVVDAIQELFASQKIKHKEVATSVSGHSVIIKKINLPQMSPEELEESIQWEAEQYIPFDINDVNIDVQILNTESTQAGQMDVLLVAAKKDMVNDLTNIAAEAKLRPRVVDLDAFTVQNAFEVASGGVPDNQTIALIHVGASLTTLNILSGGTTAFTRDIANGGNQITEEIQRSLGISAEEAEAYKCGGDGRGLVPREVPDIVQQVVEQLAGEIQRSLDFYLATSGEGEVHRVVVSGGTANIRALLDAVERRARVAVELLDPMKIAEPAVKGAEAELLQARAAQSVVAFGLALRREREKLQ